jgi:hypothetical protein
MHDYPKLAAAELTFDTWFRDSLVHCLNTWPRDYVEMCHGDIGEKIVPDSTPQPYKSKYAGVVWLAQRRGSWRAMLHTTGSKKKHLGTFPPTPAGELEAAKAYAAAIGSDTVVLRSERYAA